MDISKFSVKQVLTQIESEQSEHDLSQWEKHLVGLAVTLTRGCQACTSRRISEAVASGIAYESVEKLVNLVAAVNAGVVLRTAVESASQSSSDQTSDNKCTDGVCDIGLN